MGITSLTAWIRELRSTTTPVHGTTGDGSVGRRYQLRPVREPNWRTPSPRQRVHARQEGRLLSAACSLQLALPRARPPGGLLPKDVRHWRLQGNMGMRSEQRRYDRSMRNLDVGPACWIRLGTCKSMRKPGCLWIPPPAISEHQDNNFNTNEDIQNVQPDSSNNKVASLRDEMQCICAKAEIHQSN
jgi:hypothetical protein